MTINWESNTLLSGDSYKTPPPTSCLKSGSVLMTSAPQTNQKGGIHRQTKLAEDLDSKVGSVSDVVSNTGSDSTQSESIHTNVG